MRAGRTGSVWYACRIAGCRRTSRRRTRTRRGGADTEAAACHAATIRL